MKNREIIVGSKNKAKLKAVQSVFQGAIIIGKSISSDVSDQPFSDQETLKGAINRARKCSQLKEGAIGIGLEGGIMRLANQFFLCNWGALVDEKGQVYIASGARIPLPDTITEQLHEGLELGQIIDQYASKVNVRQKEGTIGILTNDQVSRSDMFAHVVQLLKGQYMLTKRDEI